MSDKDLVHGSIGTEGNYDVSFTGGKIVITAGLGLPEANASLSISISPKVILDEIAKKVGGPVPVEVAQFLESALALS